LIKSSDYSPPKSWVRKSLRSSAW